MGFFDDLTEQVGLLSARAGQFLDDVLVPDDVRRQLERAAKLITRGDYDQALDLLEEARDSAGNDIYRLHYLFGLCHFFKGEHRRAQKALDRALETREEAEAHYYAGLTAEQGQQWSRARRHFSRALSLEESLSYEAEVYFGLGRVFLQLDRPDRAIRELQRAIDSIDADDGELDPDAIRIFLAEAYLTADRAESADDALTDVDPPEDAEVLTLFGRVSAAVGRHAEAADYFDAALELDEHHAPTLLAAGRLARQRGDLDRAERLLLGAVNATQSDQLLGIYEELGPLYEVRHEFEQARRAFEAAIGESPDRADLHIRAARACLRLDRPDDAREHFEQADELTASDPQAPARSLADRGLAEQALTRGDLLAARRRLDALFSREDPPHPETMWLRSQLHLEDDDPGQALAEAHEALHRLSSAAPPPDDRLYPVGRLVDQLQSIRDRAKQCLAPDWHLPDSLDDAVDVEQTLESVQDFLTSDGRLEPFLGTWRTIANRMERPLSVALVGEFNVGKSTLANALVGEEIVPMGILPTTAHTCRIGYGARRTCRIVYRDEASRTENSTQTAPARRHHESGVDRLRDVWKYGDVVEVDFQEAARRMDEDSDAIHHLEYLYPHPRLRSLELVDTPGFNADDAHGEIARGVIDDAEAIVWVLDAGQALSMSEFEIIDGIRQSDERLVVVVNKLDELGDSAEQQTNAADQLRNHLDNAIGDQVAGLFPMSAEIILDGWTEDRVVDDVSQDRFDRFVERLEGDIVDRSGRLKTLEARRELGSLAERLDTFRADYLQTYRDTADALQEIETDLATETEQLNDNLPADIAERVADQVQFAIEAAVNDVSEMTRPAENWMGKAFGERSLDATDREFVTDMLADRIDGVLQRAYRDTGRRADALQDDALDRLDTALRTLGTEENRFVRRRLQALVDESRSHRVLLEERVFGQLCADIRARLDARADAVLQHYADGTLNDDDLGRQIADILPDIKDRLNSALSTWLDTFHRLLTRTSRRLADDVTLLRLEAEAKWQLDPLIRLVDSDTE